MRFRPDFGSSLLRRTLDLVLEVQIEILAVRGRLAVAHAVDLELVQVVIPQPNAAWMYSWRSASVQSGT